MTLHQDAARHHAPPVPSGRSAPPPRRGPGRALPLALVGGLGVGAATSWLQGVLDGPFTGLANAASPWLVLPFAVGALARRPRSAALLGLVACLAEVAGYYVTAELRGFTAGAYAVFWAAAALVGGPVFGLAGRSWRTATGRWSGAGAALLVGVWACEATVVYAWRLGYTGNAVVFGVVALLLLVALGFHRAQHGRIAAWLLLALPLGVTGELALEAGTAWMGGAR